MVNATKGLFISCDIPMAQFIINMNNLLPTSQKFIIYVLDSTHLFVQPHAAEMIRSAVSEFRDQNSYEKPGGLGAGVLLSCSALLTVWVCSDMMRRKRKHHVITRRIEAWDWSCGY